MKASSKLAVLATCLALLVVLVVPITGSDFNVDDAGNVVATSFSGDGSGLTGVGGGGRNVLANGGAVVGQWVPITQVLRTGPGGVEYYLGASTTMLNSSFNVDIHFTGNSCTGSAFTINTSSASLNNLVRPGILMLGAGPFSGDVYTAVPGVAVSVFNNSSKVNRTTGSCEELVDANVNGRAVSFLENVSSFGSPFSVSP